MIFDFDDFKDDNNGLYYLYKLKEINPDFRCSVFAIPAYTTDAIYTPDWIELCVHGWEHPTPRECENWTYEQCMELLNRPELRRFVKVFKAPGWQISDGCYKALLEMDYIVADQPYNRERRPDGLKVYEIGDNWHGHIQNVCGNGLEETWDELVKVVKNTKEFETIGGIRG